MDSRLLILRNFEKRQRLDVEKDNEMNETKKLYSKALCSDSRVPCPSFMVVCHSLMCRHVSHAGKNCICYCFLHKLWDQTLLRLTP